MKDHFARRTLSYSSLYQATYLVLSVLVFLVVLAYMNFRALDTEYADIEMYDGSTKLIYNRQSPLIFIGGFPRSGTTLMRAMLDAHPDVRCGTETRVLPRIIHFKKNFYTKIEKVRMKEAGITEDNLDRAMSAFILDIITHHGEPAARLCNKDPFLLLSTVYLYKLFPQAKFLFMVRDGRASIYSAITRNVTIGGYDLTDPRQCLKKWNVSMAHMYKECQSVGPAHCMLVHYEQLVLHPAHWLREILAFLDLPWNDVVLHHEEHINEPRGIQLSRLEKSTDQIIKPVNIEALTKWVGQFPQDVVDNMETIAPMLTILGYDPKANPPNYGTPDSSVLENTKLIQNQLDYWKEKVDQLKISHKDLNQVYYSTL